MRRYKKALVANRINGQVIEAYGTYLEQGGPRPGRADTL